MGSLACRALQASGGFNAALNIAQVLLQGGSTQGFWADTVLALRTSLRRALGISGAAPKVGLDPAIFEAVKRMGDPDRGVAHPRGALGHNSAGAER